MERFTRLYLEIDSTTRTGEKVEALRKYFTEASAADAAWALYFLTGRRLKRVVSRAELWEAAVKISGVPGWLLEECLSAVGDFGETLALLLPPPSRASGLTLAEIVTHHLDRLRRAREGERGPILQEIWDRLPADQRFVFHKLISGTFRVGASRTLAVRGLALAAGVPQAEMEHRVMGEWKPGEEFFRGLLRPVDSARAGGVGVDLRPYPFYLAHQLEGGPEAALGERGGWQAEWKWDGIRAQIVRRAGDRGPARAAIWSRGEELVTDAYPELLAAAESLPAGTVIDGEILAWDPTADGESGPGLRGRPLGFAALQRRLNRKSEQASLFPESGVVFVAYDALESEGQDIRARPLRERRAILEAIIARAGEPSLRLSPVLDAPGWDALAALRAESRVRRVEGLMLKPMDGAYGVGRTKGAGDGGWWKWKIEPFTIDAVLIHAQRGSGRRAGLFTDYTFGVWDREPSEAGATLVPIAKAYSGLSDEEIDRVDRFVREHTVGRVGGGFRTVEPRLVFEIAFEGLARSGRHKSGIALRFPRMSRWRTDKPPTEADTLARVEVLLRDQDSRRWPEGP